ncbi:NUDIX hydrolase [Quadrisphaera setariae]|uniref:NUDIX domain-containing protein n=1 Tax=Quadrisphaera setariae TaxID=2593304 RepID=A0A5C8ZIE6_9ACTN|nr:NUDIX domain-containing protein [Quadrisphaera setariae]TXR56948.1 NUDIX domain-containing protein [Quadrisphaera setariae]
MDTRVAAYAVVVAEHEGRPCMLLAHWNEHGRSGWTLPGGGIDPGEDLADAAVREVLEENGYAAELEALLGVDSAVVAPEHRVGADRGPMHALRIVYRARVVGGALRDEVGGSTDRAAWVPLKDVGALDRVELVDAGRRFAGLL